MQLTIDLPTLARAIDAARGVAAHRSSLPILEMSLWQTEGADTLLIAATNLQSGVIIRVPCRVDAPGRAVVPFTLGRWTVKNDRGKEVTQTGAPLAALLSDLGPGLVSITPEPNGSPFGVLAIARGGHVTRIQTGGDPDDYPLLPTVPAEARGLKTTRLPLAYAMPALTTLGRYTLPARDLSRPSLKQIQLVAHASGGALLAAADGLRGGVHQVSGLDAAELWFGVWPDVGPFKLLEGADDTELVITASGSHLFLEAGPVTLIQTRGEDNLSDIVRFMPEERATWVTVDRATLLGAIRRCAAIEAETAALYLSDDGLVIRAETIEHTATELMPIVSDDPERPPPVKAITGPGGAWVVNIKLFLDACTPIPTPELAIGLADPNSAIVVRPVGAGERTIRHVVMPIVDGTHMLRLTGQAPAMLARLAGAVAHAA